MDKALMKTIEKQDAATRTTRAGFTTASFQLLGKSGHERYKLGFFWFANGLLLAAACLSLATVNNARVADKCPLSGVKRTSKNPAAGMLATDGRVAALRAKRLRLEKNS
jgi:hypothetical protein